MIIEVATSMSFRRSVHYGIEFSRNCFASLLCAFGADSRYRLRIDYCETPALIQENQQPAVRLSQNVVSVDPDSLTMAPSPVSRSPNVIRPAHVITSPAIVIRPVANLDRNGAWVSCIPWAVVRPWTTIIGSVPRISSITSFTSACTERDRDQKQQQCRPFQSRFCSRSCGECFRLRVFKNIRFHNNGIRIRVSLHAPPHGSSVNFPRAVLRWPGIAVTINVTQQNPAMFIC